MEVNKNYTTSDGYKLHCVGKSSRRRINHGDPTPVYNCVIKGGPEPSWAGIVVDYYPNGVPYNNRFCREIIDND